MLNVLIVGQEASPNSGGARSLQDSIKAGLAAQTSNYKFYYLDKNQVNAPNINEVFKELNIDFIWYLTPYYVPTNIPFAVTVWDLAHRINPCFPEVSYTGWSFESRERFFREVLPKATFVITGTERGKYEIAHAYGIFPENIRVIPFVVQNAREKTVEYKSSSLENIRSILDKKYLLYPAQLWPHKNHVVIFEALKKLLEKGETYHLVLTGSDKGNKVHLLRKIKELGIENIVTFLGFVSDEELDELYGKAFALVYPTYFGPDNIPPLEAMSRGCPAICSGNIGAREQLEDASLYFDQDSEVELAQCINLLNNSETRNKLIKNGFELTKKRKPISYVEKITEALDLFSRKKRNWSNGYIHL
jgi:glycosyltransferase involved in cell wall biosynthesis